MFHVKHSHIHFYPKGSLVGIPAFLGYFLEIPFTFFITTKDLEASVPGSMNLSTNSSSPQYSNRLAGRLQLIFYLSGFIRNKETANLHKGHTILRQRSQICHSPGHAQIIHFPVLFLPSYILSSPMNKFHVL